MIYVRVFFPVFVLEDSHVPTFGLELGLDGGCPIWVSNPRINNL